MLPNADAAAQLALIKDLVPLLGCVGRVLAVILLALAMNRRLLCSLSLCAFHCAFVSRCFPARLAIGAGGRVKEGRAAFAVAVENVVFAPFRQTMIIYAVFLALLELDSVGGQGCWASTIMCLLLLHMLLSLCLWQSISL